MQAEIITHTTRHIKCPACGHDKDHRCNHLKPGYQFGPWYCDECGVAITGTVTSTGEIEIEIFTKQRSIPIYVLLKHDPGEAACPPIYLVLETSTVVDGNNDFTEGLEYLYNEHTCPTNWTHDIVKIRYMGDDDPHGVFEYLAAVKIEDEVENPMELFKEVIEKDEVF